MQVHTLASFFNLFEMDGLVLLVLGLLIFGKRLPEVGKNVGRTIVEFKKGLSGKDIDESPAEPPAEATVNRNLVKPQNRITASSPGRTPKSLPTTEEV